MKRTSGRPLIWKNEINFKEIEEINSTRDETLQIDFFSPLVGNINIAINVHATQPVATFSLFNHLPAITISLSWLIVNEILAFFLSPFD